MIQVYRAHRCLFLLVGRMEYLSHRFHANLEDRVWRRNLVTILVSIGALMIIDLIVALTLMVPIILANIGYRILWILLEVLAWLYPNHPVSECVRDGNHVGEV